MAVHLEFTCGSLGSYLNIHDINDLQSHRHKTVQSNHITTSFAVHWRLYFFIKPTKLQTTLSKSTHETRITRQDPSINPHHQESRENSTTIPTLRIRLRILRRQRQPGSTSANEPSRRSPSCRIQHDHDRPTRSRSLHTRLLPRRHHQPTTQDILPDLPTSQTTSQSVQTILLS